MEQEQRAWVDQDIAEIENTLKEFSFDGEKLEGLFQRVLTRQAEYVEGLDSGLTPLFSGESHAEKAKACRDNLSMIWRRLAAFRDNGYQNQSFRADPAYQKRLQEAFNSLRLQTPQLGLAERPLAELQAQLDDLEQLGLENISENEKWNRLRPYLVWLSGKDVQLGRLILPLFLMILKQ